MRNKKIEMLEEKINSLENKLDSQFKLIDDRLVHLGEFISFLSKYKRDEIVIEYYGRTVYWNYLLGIKVVSIYKCFNSVRNNIREYKKIDENHIVFTDNSTYYILDKGNEQVTEIPNFIEEKPKTKKVRKVKDENKTEKPKAKRTKTTKRNKL